MNSINFNDQELEYIIAGCQVELSYAQDEIVQINEILKKIELAKKANAEKVALAKNLKKQPKF